MAAPGAKNIALEKTSRTIITATNIAELEITDDILRHPGLSRQSENGESCQPIGISINDVTIGTLQMPTATSLGWVAYLNIGVPLVDEMANITPPLAETISYNTYVNHGAGAISFTDTTDFTLENEVNWHITGEARLTFQTSATISAQESDTLKEALATTSKASPNNTGVDVATTKEESTSVSFHAESGFLSQLQLAIMGSTGGAVKSSARRASTISGNIAANNRIKVLAVQRRICRTFNYTLPVSFSGTIALLYEKPVYIEINAPSPYPANVIRNKKYQKLVPYDLSKLKWNNKDFKLKGIAETVSSLEVEHTVFDSDFLTLEVAPSLKGDAVG